MARLTNYSASVKIADGMRPKGDNDFPLMEAHSIVVDEQGTRLDDALGYAFYVKPSDQIAEEDKISKAWEVISQDRYGVTLEYETDFKLNKPYIDKVIVYKSNSNTTYHATQAGTAILDLRRFTNGNVKIYTNDLIDCKIIIKGEKVTDG